MRRRKRYRKRGIFKGITSFFKIMFTTIIIAVMVVSIVTAITYVNNMTASWSTTEAIKNAQLIRENELRIERSKEFTDAYSNYINLILGVIVYSGVGIVTVGLGYVIHKRIESYNRAKDGMFSLKWIVHDGKKYLINPNLGTQQIAEISDESLGNKEAQYQALSNQGRIQLANATLNQPIKYNAQAKLLSGYYEKPQRLITANSQDEIEKKQYEMLSLNEAISKSKDNSWILGHCLNDNSTCNFSLEDVIHLAIVGGSGVGKTSFTAFHLMFMALKNGFKVIALDAKNGIDWQKFSNIIEASKTNKAMFPYQLEAIFEEFKNRMNTLEKLGLNRIEEMKTPPQKMLVILEEFSTLINEFDTKKKDKELVEKVFKIIDIMLKQGRAAGIHFCVIDQDNSTWSSAMKKLLRGLFIYNLGGYGAASFTPKERIVVSEKGQFAYKGKAYNSWLVADKIDDMLKTISLPKKEYKLLPVVDDILPSYDINLSAPNTNTNTNTNTLMHKNTTKTPSKVLSASVSASASKYEEMITDALESKIGLLEGEPTSIHEKKLVYNIYLHLNDKTKVCEVCWGGKNSTRWKWLNNIIKELSNE